MNDSLSADPAELRASAAKLMRQADETEQMLETIQAIIAEQGKCWGDDELGETFAKSHEPGSQRGVDGFAALVADLRSMSAGLENSADAFEQQDRLGAQQIENSGPFPRGNMHTPTPNLASGPPMQPRTTAGPHSTGNNYPQQPPGAYEPASEAAQQAGPAPLPRSGLDTAPEATPPETPGSGRPQDSSPQESPAPESPGEQAGNSPPQTAPGPPTATREPARPPSTPTNTPAGKPPETPAAPGSRGRPTAESPWVQNKPVAAPARPAAFPGAPATETPPRVSPPQAPIRPPTGTGAKPDEPPKNPGKRSKPQVAARAIKPSDPEAMRIVQEMAARYGLTIVGFESAGLDARTAQDIADAVDIVLIRHRTILRGIEISEAASSPASVENRGEAAAPVAPWIVLARNAVADPQLPAGSDGHAGRSMYTTVLRALGSAFDLMGGFRARREAQRALIAEYLRLNGTQGQTLGQVVGGYKQWRAQLGGACFDRGVFVPGNALAEAFIEVESERNAASGPAKVLHRMLVAMAR